jgi:ribulose 1,5-bisphosphate synthetase/thiazole synthase
LDKVVIVGAGPSGLFAAHELANDCDVTIIERRDYVGGSGLQSDGKLNFHHAREKSTIVSEQYSCENYI